MVGMQSFWVLRLTVQNKDCWVLQTFSGFRISLFFDFLDFSGFFWIFLGFLGPGGFRKGPGVHLDSYGQSFSPNGAILDPLGPIFVFRFFGNPSGAQIAPRRVLVLGPSGALGPWRPKADITEAEGRHFGGVWGGGAPHCKPGVCGGAAAPPQKRGPWSYLQ